MVNGNDFKRTGSHSIGYSLDFLDSFHRADLPNYQSENKLSGTEKKKRKLIDIGLCGFHRILE